MIGKRMILKRRIDSNISSPMDLDVEWIVTFSSSSIVFRLKGSLGHHSAGIQPFLTLLRDFPGRQLLRSSEVSLSD